MGTTVLEPDHAAHAKLFVPIEPAINRIGLAWFEETMAGDGMRSHTIGNLEQGGTAFPDVGPWVMVAVVEELLALILGQVEGACIGCHG
jgi:hypothetical protein